MKFLNPANQFLLSKEIELLAKLITEEPHKDPLLDGGALFMFMRIESATKDKYKNALENYLNNTLKKQTDSIVRNDKMAISEKMIFLFYNPDILNERNLQEIILDYQEEEKIAKEDPESSFPEKPKHLCELASNFSPNNEILKPIFNLKTSTDKESAIYALSLLGQIIEDIKNKTGFLAEGSEPKPNPKTESCHSVFRDAISKLFRPSR